MTESSSALSWALTSHNGEWSVSSGSVTTTLWVWSTVASFGSRRTSATAGLVGEIAYWQPRLSQATFTLPFGSADSDGREVNALGWQICNLRVRGAVF